MTRIGIQAAPGRARLTLTDGPIGARVMQVADNGARVGLVATTALLLGGDHVAIDIDVGPDAWLELVETAGTVAYDAAGVSSSWTVRIRVADGGRLIWAGEPFVVAHGANVRRSTTIELGTRAVVCLRETLVLGRSNESGGAMTSTLSVSTPAGLLLREELDLTDPTVRALPGVLGGARILDTVSLLGIRAPQLPLLANGSRFELDGPGSLARSLITDFALSSLSGVCAAWAHAASEYTMSDIAAVNESNPAKVVAAATTS